jgi:HD-GYP domain-containing protein (c-di-GMP phosphodiesterase class II)
MITDYKEYKLEEDQSNLQHIQQLHEKFILLRKEINTIINNKENYNNKNIENYVENSNGSIGEKDYKNTLFEFLNTFELHHFYVSFLSDRLDEFKDIDSVLKNEWEELKSKIINYTNVHTLTCLLMTAYDLFHSDKIHKHLEFEYNEYDKNILLWAFLLHDIGKYISFDSIDQDFYDYTP